MNNNIDITYDMRTDSNGRDPDKHSKTLRSYHKMLWSKALPNWNNFTLSDESWSYLHHKSKLGEFSLSSDCIIHEYSTMKRMEHIILQINKKEVTAFLDLSYTIGWFIIFPSNKIDNKRTINQARGCNRKIADRIDLTLECIRLYYINKENPLSETLQRYKDFFSLFDDFKGYCEYFLLQDIVSKDFSKVKFFLPFNWFELSPLPSTADEYHEYKNSSMKFIKQRNARMKYL